MEKSRLLYLIGICFFLVTMSETNAQPLYDYSNSFIATSQLGFRESSPKEVSFYGGEKTDKLPDEIPFYITKVGYRIPRQTKTPKPWTDVKHVFRYPFNEELAPYKENQNEPGF